MEVIMISMGEMHPPLPDRIGQGLGRNIHQVKDGEITIRGFSKAFHQL
jgi:hypothetical protein